MKRRILVFSLLVFALVLGGVVSAQSTSAPVINSFGTSLKAVDRNALANRTARIPVSWTTSNRPILGNLIFEQVLPDNSVINVELPRLFPWVNSNGDGVAAPILPVGSADSIKLRVRLINLLNNSNYDTKEFVLPISADGSGNSSGGGSMPTISGFSTTFTGKLNKTDLSAGTARVPVAWSSANRPLTATLVFEQIMPDNTVVNIELPRTSPWVNSSDKGVVAPRTPAGTTTPTDVRVRVRLVDLVYGRIYDQREIVVPIDTGNPAPGSFISTFTTSATAVSAAGLSNGSERVTVSWNVNNRPANSNLVFEQVMPDGRVRNAELPRDFVIVPSTGQGIITLTSPGSGNTVTFRVRLVDLGTTTTLDMKQLSLPIQGTVNNNDNPVNVTGDACYQTPFPPTFGLAAGKTAKVLKNTNNMPLVIMKGNYPSLTMIGQMSTGETFNVLEGPTCVITSPAENRTLRTWHVKSAAGVDGWIYEYSGNTKDGFVRYAAASDFAALPGESQVITFNITPATLKIDGTVTISWEVKNAIHVQIIAGSKTFNQQALNGTMTLNVKDINMPLNPLDFNISALDSQQNLATQDVKVPVESALKINSFTATPDTVAAGGTVTLAWDITGTFAESHISWIPSPMQPQIASAGTVTTTTGSLTTEIPVSSVGPREFTLSVTDAGGVTVSATAKITVTCAISTFFVSDPILNGLCADSAPQTGSAAFQQFQNGFMVWEKLHNTMVISVFYNNGGFAFYSDWDGSAYTPVTDTPPDGQIKPERGFGYVWTTNPEVRNGLGWATGAEQGYTATTQQTQWLFKFDPIYSYATLPDGRTVRSTTATGATASWTYIG